MPKKPRPSIVQVHHVTYQPEWTEVVMKGEHWILSQVQRRRRFSWGFIRAMTYELNRAKKVAVNLDNPSLIPSRKPRKGTATQRSKTK